MARPRNQFLTPPKAPHKGRARVWHPSFKLFIDLGAWGSEEADQRFRKLAAEYVLSPEKVVQTANGMTMAEMLLGHLESTARRQIKSRQLVKLASLTLAELYGEIACTEFGPIQLRTWVASIIRERDIARGTCKKYVSVVLQAFRWAFSNDMLVASKTRYADLILTNVFQGIEVRKPVKKRPADWSSVEAVAKQLTPTLATAVRVQLATGMRSGELLSMKPSEIHKSGKVHLPTGDVIDLDAETRIAREKQVIDKDKSIWLYVPNRHKTEHHGSWRAIPILPAVQNLIAEKMNRSNELPLFSPRDSMKEFLNRKRDDRKTKVQPSQISRAKDKVKKQPGDQYDPGAYRQAIERACTRANVSRFHPHQIRHAVSTKIAGEGDHLREAQALLGHSDIKTTQGYSRLQFAAAIAGAARVEKL